jgi:hypothetical protein
MGWPERDIAQAAGFIPPPGYSRHRPESMLLYRIVAGKRRGFCPSCGFTISTRWLSFPTIK